MYVISSLLIAFGIGISILFPGFWTAMIGFSLVGFGTASVVPMTFMLAGTSQKYSPGMAISIIGTYAIIGVMLGPPIIGYLAHVFGLRFAFIFLILAGLMLIPISKLYFKKFG